MGLGRWLSAKNTGPADCGFRRLSVLLRRSLNAYAEPVAKIPCMLSCKLKSQ